MYTARSHVHASAPSARRPYAHSSHLGFIGVGGEHFTYIIRFEALCSQKPFRVYMRLLGCGGEHSTYIIRFEALCSQQPFRVSWCWQGNILLTSSALRPYAHSSHLGFLGVGGGTFYLHHPLWGLMLTEAISRLLGCWRGNILLTSSALRPYAHSSHSGLLVLAGEHSTYIIRFEALCSQQPFRVYWCWRGNILLTSSPLRPYAHSSHLGVIGLGGGLLFTSSALRPYAHSSHFAFIGVGGGTSTYIIRFEALCSQQPFRVYWCWGGTFCLHHPLWGIMLTAAIEGLLGWGGPSTYIIRFCCNTRYRWTARRWWKDSEIVETPLTRIHTCNNNPPPSTGRYAIKASVQRQPASTDFH